MKIAFYSYPSAFQNPGGGEIQLLKTKQALEKKGITVKLFDQWNDKLDDFDILHVFGSVKDCVGLMRTAKNKGTKIALSTIFWSSFKRALYENKSIEKKVELTVRHLAKIILPAMPSGRRATMALADVLLPNSRAEVSQLRNLFALPLSKIHVVPNGVDERFRDSNPRLFKNAYPFRDFTLAVGRIEPRKNQLNLIKAFRTIEKDLVIVGDPVSDYREYYQLCKKDAGKNIHFLSNINNEDPLLASVYAACSVFSAPGWFETPGLASLEAGLAGAKLAVTRYGCTREYFSDMACYFDPSSIVGLKKAILAAYANPDSSKLKNHLYENYTWDKVATVTLEAYKKIIG